MAIGRISGGVLKSNLTRNGVDLAFETNLLYLDVTNNRIGIGTSEPTTTFHVNGTITATAMAVTGSTATINSKEIMVGKSEGTNFTNSLLVGHTTTGTLNDAQDNTGVGIGALDTITSADSVTAIGKDAAQAVTSGGYSTVVGAGAYFTNSTGTNNTAIGRFSLRQSSGSNNVALGKDSGESLSSGNQNIIIGSNTGDQYPTTGSGNVLIGSNIDADASDSARTLKIAGYDGTTTTTWISGDSSGNVTVAGKIITGDTELQSGSKTTISAGTSNLEVNGSSNGMRLYVKNGGVEGFAAGSEGGLGHGAIALRGQTILVGGNSSKGFALGRNVSWSDVNTLGSEDLKIKGDTVTITGSGYAYTLPTADGTANQVLKTNGSGVLSFANDSSTLDHNAISDDTTASLMQKTGISTTEKTVESNPVGTYDSALYYITSRNEIDDRVAVQKVSVVHNNTTAYASTTHITRTVEGTGQTFTADIDSGAVRLRATGSSDSNSVTAYKIPLGDFSSVGTSGNTAVVINADLDSGTEALDTWAHASYRGAKYFISVNNTTDIELESIECIVVHNGTEAYITSYNSVTTNNSLITLTATISGTNVELRGAGATANLNVKMHRILLSDSETLSEALNQKTLPATTVSSTATTIDSFDASSIHGAFYYVVGTNSAEGNASSITELAVVTDGTDAYVSTGPVLSTKGTDQLSFTATTSGSTISIQASSTSGGSTTVNAYRIDMKRDENVASANVVLKEGTQTITGAKTFSAPIVLNTTTTDDSLTITTTEASNSAAPVISLKRNSSSPADADYLGQIKFKGENDADQEVNYAKISGKILDASDGSEDGILEFAFAKAGSQNISARFRSDSLQLLNETSFRVAQGHAEFGVLASDPGGLAGYAKIYAKDESSSAEMFVQDEAGNVTKISPHNEEGEWEYYSRNTKTGKTVRVNMEEMIRDIEKLTGKSYIKNN